MSVTGHQTTPGQGTRSTPRSPTLHLDYMSSSEQECTATLACVHPLQVFEGRNNLDRCRFRPAQAKPRRSRLKWYFSERQNTQIDSGSGSGSGSGGGSRTSNRGTMAKGATEGFGSRDAVRISRFLDIAYTVKNEYIS